jgi:polynucleotide 5'-kinase involved in rRNA processing
MAKMVGTLQDYIKKPGITKELLHPWNKLIMVIGGTDTGKTTLVECIADLLSRHTKMGIVDLDIGQSNVGPPATIGWARIEGGFTTWADIRMEDFYFAGTITPVGSLLPVVVGAKLMVDAALAVCDKVIVNTTGLIAGQGGRMLKLFKIDMLSPNIILALEHSCELGHILDVFTHCTYPQIYRLPVPVHVTTKGIIKRSTHRFDKLISYFSNTNLTEIAMDSVCIRYTREPLSADMPDLKNRLISFRDEHNKDIALGIIEDVRMQERQLIIRTPLDSSVKLSVVVIGRTAIDRLNATVRDVDLI